MDAETLIKLAEKISRSIADEKEASDTKDMLLGMLPIILGYTEEQRNICRYGIDKPDVPTIHPNEIFDERYCKTVFDDADRLCILLSWFDKKKRWGKPVKLGILNGYIKNTIGEKPCAEYVYTINKKNFWMDFFSNIKTVDGQQKYSVSEINACEISNDFAVILNPFGEVYPDYFIDLDPYILRKLLHKPVYDTIKAYIEDGGVFVNTAGFPFFYAWDVIRGTKTPMSEEKAFFPKSINKDTAEVTDMRSIPLFSGTLFYRDFGAVTTFDTNSHRGPTSEVVYQTEKEKKLIGDLIEENTKIDEFRALRKETGECIPLLRARCSTFGEVYPIAAISYDRGHLVVGGMDMTDETASKLFAKAVDGFCTSQASLYENTKKSNDYR